MSDHSVANAAPEPCNCLDLTDEALKSHNTRLGWNLQVDPKTGATRQTIAIRTELVEKKRGAKPLCLIPTFCPICGQRYEAAS